MKGLCNLLFWIFILSYPYGLVSAQSTDIPRSREMVRQRQAESSQTLDTVYLNSLNLLARAYYGVNADSAFYYGKKALSYAENFGYEKGKAESWRMIGNTYEMIGDYQDMLAAYHHSKSIAERMGFSNLVAKVNLNIAKFYKQMGEYDEAQRQMGDRINFFDKDADSIQLAYELSHLSDLYTHRKHYDSALQYANRALQISLALKDSLAIASFNTDIGRILGASGRNREALLRYLQSMDYYVRSDDKLEQTETAILVANALFAEKDYDQALRYAQQGLAYARQLGRKKEIRESGQILADIYEAKGDNISALKYFRLYKDFSDSLYSEQLSKQMFAIEARYEYERKEDSLRDMAMQKDILQQQENRNHTHQIVIAVLLILFLSVLVFVLWRNKIASRQHNELLLIKNQEIEQQKEAMEHQAVQLLLNNQQKDKLFSIIAHDLKGPLNSLKGLMDLLKENKLPESEIRPMMAELTRNVGYSSELVGNLLFWASSQLDGIVIAAVALPMHQLMGDILTLFAKSADEKKIVFINRIDPDALAYADMDMTQVILRNLISNAIKFCRSGDTITIGSRRRNGFLEICVADTGIGIKEEVLEKIRRKESVTTYGTAKEKGTGLGMLLCREFIEANNGELRVDSQWGKGSEFYFTIPVAASSSSIRV